MADIAPLSSETVSGLSSAKTLTVPAAARSAWINAVTQDVRYRPEGGTPTATAGHLIDKDAVAPTTLTIEAGLRTAKFIEVTTSATLHVTYFG